MKRSFLIVPLLAGLVLPLATACAQNPQTPKDNPAPGEQIVCAAVFDPVCGTRNGKRVTFSNDCEARKAGADNVTKGACPAGN